MKYLLLKSDAEMYWFELDDDNYATRQIVLDEYNVIHVSCLEDCLAEGAVNETDIDEGFQIVNLTKQEFESVWQDALKKYEKQWKKLKTKYPVGTIVQGINRCIYPQGTIVKGKDFIAVYRGDNPFCLHKTVCYEVNSYDEVNMWLVVE